MNRDKTYEADEDETERETQTLAYPSEICKEKESLALKFGFIGRLLSPRSSETVQFHK